ncbi:hypothetical protein ACFFLZ_17175 [Photobacterium aphoticum]|uniref:hypothetical protein n=1 Tax=Photobacterium aphoticum TaxID=754436 RepID=UPI0035EC941B
MLKEAEAGLSVKELCRKHNISYACSLKALEYENAKLKKLLAESMLDVDALKAALNQKY